MKYYQAFNHTNTSDAEEEVVEIKSTEEEKKKINRILVISEANSGVMKWYVERELIGNHYTAIATIQNFLEITVDEELAINETFKITLQNVSAGVNASIVGLVEYEIIS